MTVRELLTLADDGCPHHDDACRPHFAPYVPPADSVPLAVLGTLIRELAPGLYVETNRRDHPRIWTVERCNGFTLLLIEVPQK